MPKELFKILFVLLFYGQQCYGQVLCSEADGNSSHSSSSSTSSSFSSSSSSRTPIYTGPSKEQIFRNRVNQLRKNLSSIATARLDRLDNTVNNIRFNNPFYSGSAPSQQIVDNWKDKRSDLEDKDEDNDYAKSSVTSNRKPAAAFDESKNEDDGYYIPPTNYNRNITSDNVNNIIQNNAGYYTLTPTDNNVYTSETLYKFENNGNSTNGLEVADRVVDEVLDDIEPGVGSRLKLIKEIGYKTVDHFSSQVDNFFNCQDNCVEKSEALYSTYKREVGRAFSNLIPGAESVNNVIDNVQEGLGQAKSFLKSLF